MTGPFIILFCFRVDFHKNYDFCLHIGYNHSNEVEDCLIPNCHTTTWKRGRYGILPFGNGTRHRALLNFIFDSNRKVQHFLILSFPFNLIIFCIVPNHRRSPELWSCWFAEWLWRIFGTFYWCKHPLFIWHFYQLLPENLSQIRE